MPPSREVRISEDYDYPDYADFQANFINSRTGRPMPNTRVYIGDELRVSVNSLGCFGSELEPEKPVIAIFGDSYTQGDTNHNWPSLVNVDGCQPLNAAVEGTQLHQIVDRFIELRDKTNMICAAVHTGWHNLIYNQTEFTYWERELLRISGVPTIAHFRLTADINAEAVERGYDSLYGEGKYVPIYHTSTKKLAADLWKAMEAKNRLLERLCEREGRVLITLEEILAPKTYADLTANFNDSLHPHSRIYAEIAKAVSAQLRPHVERALADRKAVPAPVETKARTARDPQDKSNYNYPLW
jgi:hypothetical protein